MEVVGGTCACTVPVGLGWDQTLCPITTTTTTTTTTRVDAFGRNVGDIATSPELLFGHFSPTRSATSNTYNVNINRIDNTGTVATGAPVRSIWKAIALRNAAAPYTVIVKGYGSSGSTYHRWNINDTGVTPT